MARNGWSKRNSSVTWKNRIRYPSNVEVTSIGGRVGAGDRGYGPGAWVGLVWGPDGG
jgi:hypothetical protein